MSVLSSPPQLSSADDTLSGVDSKRANGVSFPGLVGSRSIIDGGSQVERQPSRSLSRTKLTAAVWRKAVFAHLRGIQGGRITVRHQGNEEVFGDVDADLHVAIQIHDDRFFRAVAVGGSIGAGESYRDGYWSCDDPVALIQIFCRNMQTSNDLGGIWNSVVNVGRRFTHALNRNTRSGSRRNIAAHYDLSNEFYALFLDETMTYSSGVFPASDSTMKEASEEKYDRICRKLQLGPGDRVIEIGTGWGGFATHAATQYGCHVTTTTISQEQHNLARERFRQRGIEDRVTLLQSDYRDLTGQYDKLVSIEMIEAVGHQYFDTFFGKCASLLKPSGLMALQAITIPDQRYQHYIHSIDFIKKYIFPGGCLPSLGAIIDAVGRVTDLQMIHNEDFAEHYARTLACWRSRFHANASPIRELGMTDSFMRLWDYYLCYCEGAFREKQIGVTQITFQKPDNRRLAQYPSLQQA